MVRCQIAERPAWWSQNQQPDMSWGKIENTELNYINKAAESTRLHQICANKHEHWQAWALHHLWTGVVCKSVSKSVPKQQACLPPFAVSQYPCFGSLKQFNPSRQDHISQVVTRPAAPPTRYWWSQTSGSEKSLLQPCVGFFFDTIETNVNVLVDHKL